MAYTYDIDKTKPPDTGESPSLGAQVIRYLKEAVIERLKNLIWGFGSDAETDEGFKKVPLVTRTAPSQEVDKAVVYAKDVGGIAELFVRDENGVEIQLTTNGKPNVAGADHGGLAGLADDDHNQYYNSARHTKAIHDAFEYLDIAGHDVTTRHPKSVIKTGTGSVTNITVDTNITMQDYCFFPNIHADTSSGWTVEAYIFNPTDNYVGQFRVVNYSGAGPAMDVYYRYISASGPPEIWIVKDDSIGLYTIWECDDPAPEGKPPIQCFDKDGNKIGQAILIIPPDNYAELKAQCQKDLAEKKPKAKSIGEALLDQWEIDELSNPDRPSGLAGDIVVKTLKRKAK